MSERERRATSGSYSSTVASEAASECPATTRAPLSRRSFFARFAALVAAPFAVTVLARGAERGVTRPAPMSYDHVWPPPPRYSPERVVGRILLRTEKPEHYAWRHRLHRPSPPESPLYYLLEAERKARFA